MSDTVRMDMSRPAEPARRIEVFTGSGRRRRWSVEEKAAIVAESYEPGDTVCSVAHRHGLTPPQLFAWRRDARQRLAADESRAAPLFVPALVEAAAPRSPERKNNRRADCAAGLIELEIAGVTIRVGRGADANTVAAVIAAVKAGS